MAVRLVPIVLILSLLSIGCVTPTAPAQNKQAIVEPSKEPGLDYSWAVTKVISGNTDFAFELYSKLCAETNGNLFFSPTSISTALAMTYAGANGPTAEEMAKVLHFELPAKHLNPAFAALLGSLQIEKPDCQLLVANRLWGQKEYRFLPEFLKTTRVHYGAELAEVDFVHQKVKSAQTINRWVSDQTQGKITDLISPDILDEMTRLVLTNAIYFKGDWASKFSEGATREKHFHVSVDKKINVQLMYQKGKFRYGTDAGVKILEMPYVGKNLSMLVLLPDKIDGLAELEKKLTTDQLSTWNAIPRETTVDVFLPKFKMSTEFKLRDTLQAMGMTTAFIPGKADFSGMSSSRDLYISAVVHKAVVEVNEQGTEAAAATGVAIKQVSANLDPTFRADHPFVFVIQDKQSNNVLFVGRVVEPK